MKKEQKIRLLGGHGISEVVFGTCSVFLINFPRNNVKDKMFSTVSKQIMSLEWLTKYFNFFANNLLKYKTSVFSFNSDQNMRANLHTVDQPTSLENCHFENYFLSTK